MGGFFGHFSERFNRYGPFRHDTLCGYHPSSLKLAFRTYREFWKQGRLKLNMLPDNSHIKGATGYCLVTPDKKNFVFFVEDAESATINLKGMPGRQPIVLLDTKARFHEISRGKLTAGVHKIHFGSSSDWAIAVGYAKNPNDGH